MTHSDPDVLAMMALGEPDVSGADLTHVANCPVCRDELERLSRVTRAARENGPVELRLQEPPVRVWERIRDEIEATPRAEPVRPVAPAVAEPEPRRPRRRWWPVAVVAAVVLLVAVIAGVLIATRPTGVVEASAALNPLPAWSSSSGTATMQREPDGTVTLNVRLTSPAITSDGTTFREVWLMNRALTKSISVGLLDGGSGRFVMPANIAAADYPVVDVSEQPLNGNPAHSGDSIVRGTLVP